MTKKEKFRYQHTCLTEPNEKTKINPINIIVKIIDFTTSIKNSKLSLIHTPQPNYLILYLRVQRLLI